MKHFMFLSAISVFVFFFSCENEKQNNDDKVDICSDSILIIGDPNDTSIRITTMDTLVYPFFGNSSVYFLDLDSNQINDFKLVSTIEYSAMLHWGEMYIISLNPSCKVAVNDTIEFPEILEIADTINHSRKWISGKLIFLSYTGSNEIGVEEPLHIQGNWLNIQNSYVGLIIDDGNNLFYGWIKMGIIEKYKINIIEIARKKGCIN